MSSLVTLVSNSSQYDQERIMFLVAWVKYNVMSASLVVPMALTVMSLKCFRIGLVVCFFCKYPSLFTLKFTSGHLESLVADLSLHFISDSDSSEGLHTLLLDF